MDGELKLEIEEMVLEIIGDHFGLPVPSLSFETHIMDDCGADWFDQRELIMTVEEFFGINIPESEVNLVEKIGDIVKAISKIAPAKSDLKTAKQAWRIASRRES